MSEEQKTRVGHLNEGSGVHPKPTEGSGAHTRPAENGTMARGTNEGSGPNKRP